MSAIDILPEVTRWRARAVRYFAGSFNGLAAVIPEFQLVDFVAAPDEPPNPFYYTVMRLPLSASERPMPVGVVSKTYRLVQHGRVADLCFSALARAGIDVAGLNQVLHLGDGHLPGGRHPPVPEPPSALVDVLEGLPSEEDGGDAAEARE